RLVHHWRHYIREHAEDEDDGNRKNSDDGLRPRKSFVHEEIHHRIQQVGDDARNRQRPKHRRQNVQHSTESPYEQNYEPHENSDRQPAQCDPKQVRLVAGGWREIHRKKMEDRRWKMERNRAGPLASIFHLLFSILIAISTLTQFLRFITRG